MHKNPSSFLLSSLLILGLGAAFSAESTTQLSDSVEPDQIQYPLPTVKVMIDPGTSFEFCVVPLGIGDAPFATRKLMIGGGMEGYKAPRTECQIAGSFVMSVAKKPDWCLLVGKYEVTVAQWNSVLGLPAPAEGDAKMPITKVSRAEVTSFIEKANEKMRRQKLTKAIESPFAASFEHAFLRLPTEAEWEFAARGGNAVDSTTFGKPTPYQAELNRYEWFSGQNSSKGKLKGVGLLKPNPLGIHDMLGNASEMADGHYQVEYSQGRFGGLVIRGGYAGTAEKDMNSSMRKEVPWVFDDDGSAYRNSYFGIRLVMGAMMGTSLAEIAALNAAWEKYSQNRIQPATSVPATAPLAVKVGADMINISNITESLASKLDQTGDQSIAAKNARKDTELVMNSLRAKLKDAEARSTNVAVRLASLISHEAVTNGAKILQSDTLEPEIKKDRLRILEPNLSDNGRVMEEACEMLADVEPNSLKEAFSARLKSIETQIGRAKNPDEKLALQRLAAATEVARKISMDYVQYRRINLDEWKNGLMKISKTWVEELKAKP